MRVHINTHTNTKNKNKRKRGKERKEGKEKERISLLCCAALVGVLEKERISLSLISQFDSIEEEVEGME